MPTGPVRPTLRSVAAAFAVAAVAVAFVAIGSLAASGQVVQEPDAVIDFEDLPYETLGEFQVVSYHQLTDFYRDRGVTFDPPVRGLQFDPAEVLEQPSFAASGSGFIAPQCPQSVFFPQAEFVAGICRPVAMRFEAEMSAVSVVVGAEPSNENRTLTLEALDAGGDPIAGVSVDFPETGDLTPIETPLTVAVEDGGIFGARLYWIGGSTTAFLVDDVGLAPFTGTPDIRARASQFQLMGATGVDTAADAVTVIFDNVGTGPSIGHRFQIVAPEPFDDGPLRIEPIDCPDPLDRGGSCVLEITLQPDEVQSSEPGEYRSVAELWFEDRKGMILEAVDLDVTVVVVEPDDPVSDTTVTDTTVADNTVGDDTGSTVTTASPEEAGATRTSESDPDSSGLSWIVMAVAAAGVFAVVRRRRGRPGSVEPTTAPPPPPPPPPPHRITVRNTLGRQHVTRGDGPLLIITATRPPGRVVTSEITDSGTGHAVPVTEGDRP